MGPVQSATAIELVDARINAYQMETADGRVMSGIAFKAVGLKPAVAGPLVSGGPAGSGRGEDK